MIYNFSNIKAGGGIQVSLSFLYYLSKLKSPHNDTIILSKKLNLEIDRQEIDLSKFKILIVKNFFHKIINLTFHNHNIVYTIFGPTYGFKGRNVKWVNGFAQAWILFPNNKVYSEIGFIKRHFLKLKFKIQKKLFSKSDTFVVEHKKIKNLLEKTYPKKNIIVANNSINEVFKNNKLWREINVDSSKIKIGIMGNSYVHKNLKILPFVKRILSTKYNIDADFFVTLTEYEMKKMSNHFRQNINSLGRLSIYQCPNFYLKMDIIFFPSNLECFSATPIESIYMKKKIVCSNYFFNKYYESSLIRFFEPNNPEDAALQINLHLKNKIFQYQDDELINLMKKFNPKKRFKIIYEYINQNL